MPSSPRSALIRHGSAAAAVILATAARLALDPVLGDRFPFATLFLAILIAAAYGGLGPALLATALGALASARFLLPPRDGFAVHGFEDRAGLLLYLVVGAGIALLGGALRLARRQAEAHAQEALRQEDRVREVEHRPRAILESITDAFFALGRDWRFTYVNRQAEALLGRDRDDLLGKPLWEEYPPAVGTEFERSYRRAMDEGVTVTFEAFYPPHDRWYEVHAYPSPEGLAVYFRDVNERKGAEEQHARLVAASERLRRTYETALSNTLDFNYIFDLDGRFTFVNATLLGLWQRRLDEAVGRDFNDLGHPPELAARLQRQIRHVIETARSVRDEAPYASHLGERMYEYIFVPVLGAEGGVEAVVGSTRDITERKRTEEALRESEERFRGLMEQAPFSIQVLSPDGRTLRVNRAWEELWGLTLDQLADYNMLRDPQLEAKGILPHIRRAFAGEPAQIPAIQYDPNETLPDRTSHADPRRWVSAVAYPLKDAAGRIREVVLVHDDITERKRAEEVAERRAAELDAVIDSMPDAVYVGTAEGMTKCNANALRMLGFTSPSDLRKDIADLRVGIAVRWPESGEHLKPEELQFARALRGETVIEEVVIRRVDSGEDVFLRVAAAPVVLNGRIAGAVAVNSDVTDRKRFEAALREADRRKDEFLATLAHELRNPLAPIRHALHLMRGPADAGHEPERAMAERQVAHLVRLVDDLMDVARISKGKIELRTERLDLAEVVGRAVESARMAIDEHGHELTVSTPGGVLLLKADPTRLEQVFWNLLNNAAKYTEPGGRIGMVVERDGDAWVVRVRDTGIGIGPDLLPRVFDLFIQAEAGSVRSQGGLGIGLGLVKSLVELHGGSITAHSEGLGTGSEFVVRLPALAPGEPHAGTGQPEPTGEATPPPRRRILIVDDNADAANVLAKLLTRVYGQVVEVAHDGPSALEVVEGFRPEVVLLDIGMPGMDGHEVARRLRGRPEFERTSLVALTGWGQEQDRRRSRQAGFDHHLVKPVAPDELIELLRSITAQTRSADG